MKFTPVARQAEAIEFLRGRDRAILSLCAGYGKSVCSLLALPDDVGILIIVCPNIVVRHWMAEVAKWRPSLGAVQWLKTSKTKVKPDTRVIIVTYGVLTNRMKPGGAAFPAPDAMIIDEFHALKTPYSKRNGKVKGQRTGATFNLMKSARIAYLLSGTPILNRPSELGTTLKAFGLIKNLRTFQAVYCAGWQAPWGWVKDGSNPDIEGLKELLEPVMFRRPASDLKNITAGRLPPRVLELDLPVDRWEKAFRLEEIEKNPNPLAFEGMSLLLKESGIRKAPLVAQHVADVLEMEECVVVFAWHKEVVRILAEKLDKHGVVTITGDTEDSGAAAEEFQTGDARVCVINIAAGVGVNLWRSSYVIMAECPWNPSLLDQAISRCDRIGQENVVRVDICTVYKSVDAHILHHILNKESVIDSVITTTHVEESEMSDKITGLDRSLLRTVEFRAEELGLSLEEWIVGAQYDTPAEKPAKKKPASKTTKKKPAPKPEPVVSLDDVRGKMRDYIGANGGDATRELLGKFGANKLTDIAEADYAAVMKAMS